MHNGVAFLGGLHDLRRRPIQDFVVVTFHADPDAFARVRRHAILLDPCSIPLSGKELT